MSLFSSSKEKEWHTDVSIPGTDKTAAADLGVKKPSSLMPIPAFSDIAKAANDLLSKDFYHMNAANLEIKSKAPNGVAYTVKGKSSHEGSPSGSLEAKKADKSSGTTGSATFGTAGNVDLKLELENNLADGLKADILATMKPDGPPYAAKMNLTFKQQPFHVRTFFDFLKGPTATVDAVLHNEGFLVGGEAGYDVQKAAVTRYSAALGYQSKSHTTAITASNNLSIFAASYFHKVNDAVQAGARATYDSKNAGQVGLEVASKYQLDPMSFMKARVDDKGIAAVSYNAKVNSNFTLGIGASFDTQKLNESTHKLGMHFAFEG